MSLRWLYDLSFNLGKISGNIDIDDIQILKHVNMKIIK